MNKNKTTTTKKLPMGKRSKRMLAIYATLVLCMTCLSTTAFAAGDPITVVNNLSDFIFGLIRAIGMILLGFGIVQIGLSLKVTTRPSVPTAFLLLPVALSSPLQKKSLPLSRVNLTQRIANGCAENAPVCLSAERREIAHVR